MVGKQIRQPGEAVRTFIVRNIGEHPDDIVTVTAKKFGCTRQAVHKHIARLIDEGAIAQTGESKRKPGYKLAPLETKSLTYALDGKLAENDVWERDVFPHLQMLPKNVVSIWHYVFTEMVNNAIDHSAGRSLLVRLDRNALMTRIMVKDDGVGIFRKITRELELADERLAILELSKGKLTTDPANHTGQGIFFSSRMMDHFDIMSGGLTFDHERGKVDVLLEGESQTDGTLIDMVLDNHTSRSTKKVFDEFSSQDGDYRFNKTIVPVSLANYGPGELVSRSQAKRLLARVDQFEIVGFDFEGVETIGQAFADEIFRVYARAHPNIQIVTANATHQIKEMIARAKSEQIGRADLRQPRD